MDHGTSQGWEGGHKGECPTWEGRKKNWTVSGLGDGGLALYLKAGSLHKETQKGTLLPISPLPFPELVQGLEECPWSVGPVLSSHPFKCSHFQVTILLGPAMGRACLAYQPDFYALNLELRKYMHRSQRDVFISDCT